ncbi:MAG: glycosyltransferase family 4 protein [Candidatus Marsarchaeota archaeon]|nr:glycosyltransferase family 4 protein [Candidatus Marsarchaeota archaeon]
MRILHITDNSYPTIGGVERVVHEVAKRQVAMGHCVSVVTRTNSLLSFEQKSERIDSVKYLRFPTPLFPFASADYAEVFDPEVVHVNSYLASKLFTRTRHRVLRHVHDVLGVSAKAYFGGRLAAAVPPFERVLLGGFKDYLVPSLSTMRKLRQSLHNSSKIWLLPNGVDTSVFHPYPRGVLRNMLGLSGPTPIIMFLGRLALGKGALDALYASLRLLLSGEAVLVYVGPSNTSFTSGQKPALREIIREARSAGVLGRVYRLPPQPDDLLAKLISDAAVVLCPSKSEGFGLVPVEAAACGTPSIVYPVGSLPEVVINNVTGIISEDATPQSMAFKLEALIRDPDRRERMSHECVGYASKFDWRRVVDELMSIYDQL